MARLSGRGRAGGAEYCDLVYADDVISAIARRNREVVTQAANEDAGYLKQGFAGLGLGSTLPKSFNFLMASPDTTGGFFRRFPLAFRDSDKRIMKEDDEPERKRLGDRGAGATEVAAGHPTPPETFPYRTAATVTALGAISDDRFSFAQQAWSIIDRAKVRWAILPRISGCVWGAEGNLMRRTPESPVLSLRRYGLAVTGSKTYGHPTEAGNLLAGRRATGVGRAARIPALRATAGILSARNTSIQRCA